MTPPAPIPTIDDLVARGVLRYDAARHIVDGPFPAYPRRRPATLRNTGYQELRARMIDIVKGRA